MLNWHVRNLGLYPTSNGERVKGFKRERETQLDLNFRMTLEYVDWESEWMAILLSDLSLASLC